MSKAVLYLHALTPMHSGSGTALGVVDLPIQRERHTHWPVIPGSSLKGVLRDAVRLKVAADKLEEWDLKQANESEWVSRLFGSAARGDLEGGLFAGALSITDARMLAFPVRSLRGVFAWVTCPAVLSRLRRDLCLAGEDPDDIPPTPSIAKDEALCADISGSNPLLVESRHLLLEEFEFKAQISKAPLFKWLAQCVTADEETQTQIQQKLVLLHDDDYTHFVRHATEVMARVGLDYETKTVKPGALFYEEFLPAESLFYSVLLADASRDGDNLSAAEVMAEFKEYLPNYIQIGGDATIGKGLCAVHLAQGGEA